MKSTRRAVSPTTKRPSNQLAKLEERIVLLLLLLQHNVEKVIAHKKPRSAKR